MPNFSDGDSMSLRSGSKFGGQSGTVTSVSDYVDDDDEFRQESGRRGRAPKSSLVRHAEALMLAR